MQPFLLAALGIICFSTGTIRGVCTSLYHLACLRPLVISPLSPLPLTITPHNAVCNCTLAELLTGELWVSPPQWHWELLEVGGLGLVHLYAPLSAKSRVGAPERRLEFSGDGWPFNIGNTTAVFTAHPPYTGTWSWVTGGMVAVLQDCGSFLQRQQPAAGLIPKSSEPWPSSHCCSHFPLLHPPSPLENMYKCRQVSALYCCISIPPLPEPLICMYWGSIFFCEFHKLREAFTKYLSSAHSTLDTVVGTDSALKELTVSGGRGGKV